MGTARRPGGAAVGGERRGLFGLACDEAVSSLGVVPDTPLADELSQDGADGLVAGCGAVADLALGERRIGFGERLEDAPFGGFGLRRGIGGVDLAEAQRGPLAVVGEFDLHVVEAGGGAVLDGHDDLPVAAPQVEIRIAPGVQFRAPAQGLSRPCGAALSGMMDEQHGGPEAALDVAQEAEDGGDLGDGIFVDAVQPDEGVEDDEAGADAPEEASGTAAGARARKRTGSRPLTPGQEKIVRAALAAGVGPAAIARQFGIARTQVLRIAAAAKRGE